MNQIVETPLLVNGIKHTRNQLISSVANRKIHPSYGYTKAMLKELLAQLEGMLYGYYLVNGGHSVNLSMGANEAYSALFAEGSNHVFPATLVELHAKVRAA